MRNTRKQKQLIRYAVIALIGLILLNGFINVNPNAKEKLIIKGSTSVEPFMKAVKNQTKDNYTISLSAQGSGTGITSLFDNKANIAMSSRDLKTEEKEVATKKGIEVTEVAKDGISVILNEHSPIKNLTHEQLVNIYTGKITNWKEIDPSLDLPINVIARDEASGTREGFDKLLNIKTIASNSKQIEATGEVIRTIAENKGAIGYVSSGSNFTDVKVINVDGVEPTESNIKNQKYELFRRFYLLNYKNDKVAHTFVQNTTTKEMQTLLKNKEYKANFISILK